MGAAWLEAVIHTAALDEAARNAWCREKGIYHEELERWRVRASESLGEEAPERVSPQQARKSMRGIKPLERDPKRKEKALAETAALLVLSKKLSTILHENGDD